MTGTTRPGRATGAAPTAILALTLLAACGGDPAPRPGGTAVIAAGSDLDFANPLVSADAWTNEILRYALFTPLVAYGPDLSYEPRLAESWEMIGDTAVVFHLRRDVRWHDGTPTTAEDVLFTFRRARDPATGFPNAGYFSRWTAGEAVDSYTVRFRMEPHAEPLAGWPYTPVVPRHVLDTVPPERLRQAAFNHDPLGNGPFRFVSQRANDRWVFEANPEYPEGLGGPPRLDRLVWRVVPENSAQLAELRAGEADLVLQPRPEQVRALADRPGIRAVVKPSRQFMFIAWNEARPPLDDPRVRKALALALDRRQILEGLRYGFGELALGPILAFHWAYADHLAPLPFAPDSALALLAEAGIRDGDGDGVLERPDGTPFRVELKVPAGSDYNRDVAEAIRGDLAAIGVDLVTRPTEVTTLFADITDPERRFDAALLGWSGDFRIDLHDTFHSDALGGPYQFASYANPETDSLMDRAELELERDRAIPLWHRVQEILLDEQPWTLIYYQTDAFLARDRVRGMEMDIRGALVSLPRWWIDAGEEERGTGASQTGGVDGD